MNENSEEHKQMLADKAKACMALIEESKKATKITRSEFDSEKGKFVIISEDIPEGVKEAASEYLMQLATNNYSTYTIYHGQDGVADYIFWLSYDDGVITLREETDCGMKFHHNYSGKNVEDFLNGVKVLEESMKSLSSVKIERKP